MLAQREQPNHRFDPPPAATPFVACAARPGASARSGRGDSASLVALAGGALDARFRSWRGASGQRYTFSVYGRRSCPAYENAVAMVARIEPDGARRIIFIGDTGCFPDILFAEAANHIPADGEVEFHVHLLATSRAGRAAVIADLSQVSQLKDRPQPSRSPSISRNDF
jgi:hypothetical protein